MFASTAFLHRMLRKGLVVCALALVAAALVAPSAQGHKPSGPKLVPPKGSYLALGDSLAFGYQQAKFNALFPNEDPAAFNTGYVDDFAASLARIKHGGIWHRGIDTTNYGCPGEWTDSFLGAAPCPYSPPFPLHDPYAGSQMDAALSFLRAHRGRTSPVTIDIGANDVLHVVNACNANPAPFPDPTSCIVGQAPATFAHIGQNLDTILGRIQAAAGRTELIVVGVYNPLVVTLGPSSDALTAQLNSVMASVAAAHNARFADPLPVFNPPGPNEIPTICALTAICTPLHDIHPTDAGYQALADVVFAASGYGRLKQKED
jgi:lysophospholipase L1-like esterase